MRPASRGSSSSRANAASTPRTSSRGEHNKQTISNAPYRELLPNKHQRDARVPQAIAAREQLQQNEGKRRMSVDDALKQITAMRRRGSFAMPDYHGDTFASAGLYSDGHVYLSRRRSFSASTGGMAVPHKSPWQERRTREEEAHKAAAEAAGLQSNVKNHDPSQDVNANIRRALGLKTAVIELNEVDPLGNLINVNPDDMTKGNPFLEGFKPLFEQVREAQRAAGIDLSLLTEANKAREAAALENSRPQLRKEKSRGGDKAGRGADRHHNPDAEPEIITVVEAPAWYGDAGIQPQLVKAMQLNTFLGIQVAQVPADTLAGGDGALASATGVRRPVSRERTSRLSRHDPRMHRFRILPHEHPGSGDTSTQPSRTPTRRGSHAGPAVHWGGETAPPPTATRLDRSASASSSDQALRSPSAAASKEGGGLGSARARNRRGSMGGSPVGCKTHFALLEVVHRRFPQLEDAVDAVVTAVLYVAELEEGIDSDAAAMREGELPPLHAQAQAQAQADAHQTRQLQQEQGKAMDDDGDMLDYPFSATAPLPVLHAHARPSFLENSSGGGPDSPGPHDVLHTAGPGPGPALETGAQAGEVKLHRGYHFQPTSSVSSMPHSVLESSASASATGAGGGEGASGGRNASHHSASGPKRVSMKAYTGVNGGGPSMTEGEAMGSQFGGPSVLSSTGGGASPAGRPVVGRGVGVSTTPASRGRTSSSGSPRSAQFARQGTFKGFSPSSTGSPSRGKSMRNLTGTGVGSPPQGAMPVLVFQRHAGANAEETAAARAVELATAGYERWFAAGVQGGDLRQFEAKVRRQKVFARLTAERPRRGLDAESPKQRAARSASPPRSAARRSSSGPAGLERTTRSAGSSPVRPARPPSPGFAAAPPPPAAVATTGVGTVPTGPATGAAGVIDKVDAGSSRPATRDSTGRRPGRGAGHPAFPGSVSLPASRLPLGGTTSTGTGAPYRAKSPLVTTRGATMPDGQVRFYSREDEKEALLSARSAALKTLKIKEEGEAEGKGEESKGALGSGRAFKGSRASSASSTGRKPGMGRSSATRTRVPPLRTAAVGLPSSSDSTTGSARGQQAHVADADVEAEGSFASIEESLEVIAVSGGGGQDRGQGIRNAHPSASPASMLGNGSSATPQLALGPTGSSRGPQDVFEEISVRMQASLKEIADRYMPKPYPASASGSQLLSQRDQAPPPAAPGQPAGGSFLSSSQVLARTQGGVMGSLSSPVLPPSAHGPATAPQYPPTALGAGQGRTSPVQRLHPSASYGGAPLPGAAEPDGDDLEVEEARAAQAARKALNYQQRPQSKGAAQFLSNGKQSAANGTRPSQSRGGTRKVAGKGTGTAGEGSALEAYLQQVGKKAAAEGSMKQQPGASQAQVFVADLDDILAGKKGATSALSGQQANTQTQANGQGQRPATAQLTSQTDRAQGSRPVQSSQNSKRRLSREGAGALSHRGGQPLSDGMRDELEAAAAMAAALLASVPKGMPATPAGHGVRAVRALSNTGVILSTDLRPVQQGKPQASSSSARPVGGSSARDVADGKSDSPREPASASAGATKGPVKPAVEPMQPVSARRAPSSRSLGGPSASSGPGLGPAPAAAPLDKEEAAAVFLQGMVEMADDDDVVDVADVLEEEQEEQEEEEEEQGAPPALASTRPRSGRENEDPVRRTKAAEASSQPQAEATPLKRAASAGATVPPTPSQPMGSPASAPAHAGAGHSPVVVIGTPPPAGTPSPSKEPVQAVGVVVLPSPSRGTTASSARPDTGTAAGAEVALHAERSRTAAASSASPVVVIGGWWEEDSKQEKQDNTLAQTNAVVVVR